MVCCEMRIPCTKNFVVQRETLSAWMTSFRSILTANLIDDSISVGNSESFKRPRAGSTGRFVRVKVRSVTASIPVKISSGPPQEAEIDTTIEFVYELAT